MPLKKKVVYVRILPVSDLVWSYLSGALDFFLRYGWLVMECLGEYVVLSLGGGNPIRVPTNFRGSKRENPYTRVGTSSREHSHSIAEGFDCT